MTEQDLPMLHEWLNRPHSVEWWGGEQPSLADPARLGQGLGTRLVRALVEQLFRDPRVTKIQTDPAPNDRRAIRCYEKAGFVPQRIVSTPDGPALYRVQTRMAVVSARSAA